MYICTHHRNSGYWTENIGNLVSINHPFRGSGLCCALFLFILFSGCLWCVGMSSRAKPSLVLTRARRVRSSPVDRWFDPQRWKEPGSFWNPETDHFGTRIIWNTEEKKTLRDCSLTPVSRIILEHTSFGSASKASFASENERFVRDFLQK